jgi:hypothetical protein
VNPGLAQKRDQNLDMLRDRIFGVVGDAVFGDL